MTFPRDRWLEGELWAPPRRRQAPLARPVRIGVAVEERYLTRREPTALVARLTARGHAVELLDPEEAALDPLLAGEVVAELDALVARGRSPALLALLRRAERLGVPVLNRASAIVAVQDRWGIGRALAAGNVPTPHAYLAPVDELVATLDDASFPLVVKPVRAGGGGAVPVRSREELAALRWREPLALAQRLVEGPGRHLALYVAAGSVYAARRASKLHDRGERDAPAERVAPTPGMRALALRVGALFGLDIYGLDIVESEQGLVVVDVDDFPDYPGIDEADGRLADLVVARAFAGAAVRGEP